MCDRWQAWRVEELAGADRSRDAEFGVDIDGVGSQDMTRLDDALEILPTGLVALSLRSTGVTLSGH